MATVLRLFRPRSSWHNRPMPQAARHPDQRKAKSPKISLRISVSLTTYQKISEFRHTAQHESRQQALLCLLNAGLVALAKPATLPTGQKKNCEADFPNTNGEVPQPKPPLVPYAGFEGDGRSRSAVNR
ncbi:hypothetical protein ACG873_12390 [Mesorhizobium sp. AaZ16]|uniref:hypothetical protein n=1 Tax=Mesorhizobium sp. AaZ16 TaxID=3402289 RepID=UPI00374EC97C